VPGEEIEGLKDAKHHCGGAIEKATNSGKKKLQLFLEEGKRAEGRAGACRERSMEGRYRVLIRRNEHGKREEFQKKNFCVFPRQKHKVIRANRGGRSKVVTL